MMMEKKLNLLNTNSKSIQTLLETIEQKLFNQGFSKDKQRVSTHPYFEDRILLIKNFKDNKKYNFNTYPCSNAFKSVWVWDEKAKRGDEITNPDFKLQVKKY